MSNFSFKSLFKRFADTSIPKVYLWVGGSFLILIIIGMIVGNMYLQEMLFLEGIEKAVPFYTEEELREYGELYKELSMEFQNEIGALSQDFANRTNRAGERIHYGVYNHEHAEVPSSKLIKIHNNGQNINKSDAGHMSDYDDSNNSFVKNDHGYDGYFNTFIDSDEFKNGVTINYTKTEGRAEGESNFKDILSIVSMIIDQKQGKNGENIDNQDIKKKVPRLIKELFKMSHTYTAESSDLYPCEKGCRVLFYYCNEVDSEYKNTGIDLKPFQIDPHDDFDEYCEEDFELIDPVGECVICGHNGKGCETDSGKCYHGSRYTLSNEGSVVFDVPHSIGTSRTGEGCDPEHNEPKDHCTHYECECEEECSHDNEDEIGCAGVYNCTGHEHWNCPGHFYVCCFGHTDLTVKIKIMYIDEMINVLKNGYSSEATD